MSETILTAENLKFRYDSEQPGYALNGVSMQVRRGEFVAVLGANGCGKSTLAKHFNAILLPEEGKVYVEGMDTADDDKLYDIRQTVGMVFQSPDNQIVATVVEEDVAFALENLGVPPEEMRRRVDDAMKMAGIYEFRERAPHNLSGGQKQRVAIAGVVAMRPDCLILDEATAMLDPRGREQVMQTIHHLNKDLGMMKVRVQDSALMERMIQLLGAIPVPLDYDQVYSAFQTDEIDAAENNWPSYESMNHEEVAGYYTKDEHSRVPEVQLASRVTWERLTKEDQEMIRQCAEESARYERTLWEDRSRNSEEIVRRNGCVVIELSPAEKARFQAAVTPIYHEFCKNYMDIIEWIKEEGRLLEQEEAEP